MTDKNEHFSDPSPSEKNHLPESESSLDNDFLSERDLLQFYLPPILDDDKTQEDIIPGEAPGSKLIVRRRKVKKASKHIKGPDSR